MRASPRVLLTCMPTLLTVPTYIATKSGYYLVGFYLAVALLFAGVAIAILWLRRFRRNFRASSHPWYVWLTFAVHIISLLCGMMLTFIAWAAWFAGPW